MSTNITQKHYYCPWTNTAVSGITARNCNYSNLEDNNCNHTKEPCVAKEGLVSFVEFLTESLKSDHIGQIL